MLIDGLAHRTKLNNNENLIAGVRYFKVISIDVSHVTIVFEIPKIFVTETRNFIRKLHF